MAWKKLFFVISFNILSVVLGRKHPPLKYLDERRTNFEIVKFGFFKGGYMSVNITNMTLHKPGAGESYPLLGFTLDMSGSSESATYKEDNTEAECALKPGSLNSQNDSVSTIYIIFNFTDPQNVTLDFIRWGSKLWNLRIVPMDGMEGECREEPQGSKPASSPDNSNSNTVDEHAAIQTRRKRDDTSDTNGGEPPEEQADGTQNKNEKLPPADQVSDNAASADDKDAPVEKKPEGDENAGDGNEDEANPAPEGKGGDNKNNERGEDETGDGERPGSDVEVQVPKSKAVRLVGTAPPPIRIPVTSREQSGLMVFNTSFVVCIREKSEEGLYTFFYHNCKGEPAKETLTSQHVKPSLVNLSLTIVQKNQGPNYLSAGEIPLPTLYTAMSVLFFCSAIYWIYYLCHQPSVFKIHYLMFFLGLLKSLSLIFHAVDYHFIAQDGRPMQAFEIVFYITYLIKGALMFGTIVLIGSGWAFIKPILSDQDKKLFWIVIPLQILANVAYIIMDTSEESQAEYHMWKVMFVTVDIICCGAILYPVIWSIRHLQDAAHTDGKAAISLVKLRLFRSYYVLVVCYIYFSRIVVYLLKVTMPFQFMWLDEFFFELATYVFYLVTAYKFRPGTDNPYLQLPSDDEDDDELEMEEVISETAMSEGVKRVGGNGTRAIQREANHSA